MSVGVGIMNQQLSMYQWQFERNVASVSFAHFWHHCAL